MNKLFLSAAFCFALIASANAGMLVEAASGIEAKQAEISNKISSAKASAEAKNAAAKEETSSALAEKKKNLDNEYIHVIVDALYKDVYNMKFNWTDNIDVDLNTIYDNINAKYKEKFNRLTMVNYIRAELKKYDLRDFNLDFVIITVDSILRNKDKV